MWYDARVDSAEDLGQLIENRVRGARPVTGDDVGAMPVRNLDEWLRILDENRRVERCDEHVHVDPQGGELRLGEIVSACNGFGDSANVRPSIAEVRFVEVGGGCLGFLDVGLPAPEESVQKAGVRQPGIGTKTARSPVVRPETASTSNNRHAGAVGGRNALTRPRQVPGHGARQDERRRAMQLERLLQFLSRERRPEIGDPEAAEGQVGRDDLRGQRVRVAFCRRDHDVGSILRLVERAGKECDHGLERSRHRMLVPDAIVALDPAATNIRLNRHQDIEQDLVEWRTGAQEIEHLVEGQRRISIEQRRHDPQLGSQVAITSSFGEIHVRERSVSVVRTTAPNGRALRLVNCDAGAVHDDGRATSNEDAVTFTIRQYRHPQDFARIGRFLIDTYRPGPVLVNWLQPRWEYMFSHPFIDRVDLSSIGVLEAADEILGVVHPEDSMTFVYFAVRQGHDEAKPALLDWAETHFGGWSHSFERSMLGLWIDEHDEMLTKLALERGFERSSQFSEPHAQRSLLDSLPATPIPDGYRIQSLADENDFEKINRVLWKGFNHEGPAPAEEIPGRIRAQDTPGFRRDLTIVAVGPDGEYVSFAGLWLVPENRIAYVEPVATDPAHRRLGLGRAAVIESLHRGQAEGAEVAWVGSDQEFYASFGFEVTSHTHLYVRFED